MNLIKSGHRRMMKYYKFHKKDSAKYFRKKEKQSKVTIDSLLRAERNGEKLKNWLAKKGITGDQQWLYTDSIQQRLKLLHAVADDPASSDSAKLIAKREIKLITKDKVNKELARGSLPGHRPYSMAEYIRKDLQRWYTVLKDTTASDSLKKVARSEIKSITLEHAMKNPQFKAMYDHYDLYGQKPDWETLGKYVPELDTLKGVLDSSPEEIMKSAEQFATKELIIAAGLDDFNKQASELESFKSQVNDFSDPEKLKTQGKHEAEKQALAQFEDQAQKIQSAQTKVSKLLDKYRSFTDSNDLSDAVKKTSLQGKTFKERLVVGGNFNVVSTDPVSLDLAPLLGYRLNTKFYVGLSANYRHTFSDSLRYKWYVSPANSSLRLFTNYDVFRNFFTYGEVERAGLKLKSNDTAAKKWRTNYFAGIGKKILITPKIFMTVTALYNLNGERNNPTYPRRFQIRMGFQSSDLAFRKKKIYYNP